MVIVSVLMKGKSIGCKSIPLERELVAAKAVLNEDV